MRGIGLAVLATGLVLGVAVPDMAAAQQAGRARAEGSQRGRVERERERVDRRRESDRDRRARENRGRAEDRGPAFCRSGEGHPVFGRRWCTDRGWRLGRDDDRRDRRDRDDWWQRDGQWDWGRWDDRRRDDRWDREWERVRWPVGFYNPRYRQGELRSRDLVDLLGRRSYDRFDEHRRRLGLSGALNGFWTVSGRGFGLQLVSGGRPVAALLDANRDGRVDEIYLLRRR